MKELDKTVRMEKLVWKDRVIPHYYIDSNGVLYKYQTPLSTWKINGRNYSRIVVDGKQWQYRIDYMVAYTFLGQKEDAVRLVHINGDIADDRLENLMWFRKADIQEKYRNFSYVEPDGSICEVWAPCITEGNPSLGYEVSTFGEIRDSNHQKVPLYEDHGYKVFYYTDDTPAKRTKIKLVHRAVAEAFIPNPHNHPMVNHIDGNKSNDVVLNLEWVDRSMNSEHAYLQGLNTQASYTEQQVRAACQLLATSDLSQVVISMMTGIDRKTLSDIYRGRRWADVSSQYKMREKKWTPEIKEQISQMIISGMKGKEIYTKLGMEYDQPAISLYERLRRELKSAGKLS